MAAYNVNLDLNTTNLYNIHGVQLDIWTWPPRLNTSFAKHFILLLYFTVLNVQLYAVKGGKILFQCSTESGTGQKVCVGAGVVVGEVT